MSNLDVYRSKASFNVQGLKNLVETAEVVEYRDRVWETLASDPLFSQSGAELTCDEQQLLTFRRTKRIVEYDFAPVDEYVQFPMQLYSTLYALYAVDACIPAEYYLSAQVNSKKGLVICPLTLVPFSVYHVDVWNNHPDGKQFGETDGYCYGNQKSGGMLRFN